MRQYSLICSALLSLRKGGTLVYSTCSISPLENDGVIERVLKKKGDQVELDPETGDLSDLERTRCGFQIFPDLAKGAGPIYIARLKVK
jgi:16S rRNA C967 or C1407 C5-methylase (RsmB/RsmF family)